MTAVCFARIAEQVRLDLVLFLLGIIARHVRPCSPMTDRALHRAWKCANKRSEKEQCNVVTRRHYALLMRPLARNRSSGCNSRRTHAKPSSLVRLCARICARITAFLLAIRRIAQFRQNRRFSIAKTIRFATKSDALKSMISQS